MQETEKNNFKIFNLIDLVCFLSEVNTKVFTEVNFLKNHFLKLIYFINELMFRNDILFRSDEAAPNLTDSLFLKIFEKNSFSKVQVRILKFPLSFNFSNKTFNCSVFVILPSLIYTLLVWLSVSLYPINVKTAEPIGPKFCVGLHMPPVKGYEKISLQLN